MIYTNYDKNNNLTSFIISCNCCCGNSLLFKIYDNEIIISSLSDNFYNKQRCLNNLKSKVENIENIILNKTIYNGECILTEEDMTEFLELARKLNFSDKPNNEKTKRESCLSILKITISENKFEYSMFLKPKQKLIKYFLNKEFFSYQTSYTKKEWEYFLDKLECFLKNNKKSC